MAARSRRTVFAAAVMALAVCAPSTPAVADAAGLRAGAGRADITPPTGYYMMGWVRSDAAARGQHTRLFARAIVLERGDRRLALVTADLGSLPYGLVVDVAERVPDLRAEEIIVSASHTHSAPAGYFNYPAFNTIAPTDTTPTEFELAPPADERLYTFLARRLSAAIRRAARDAEPAVAGWGETRLVGVTQNRSIEAHLANHGIARNFGEGDPSLDPLGDSHTIDPQVNVLRVDKLAGDGTVPIGMWSTFANHGTVVKPTFPYYGADHHAAAARIAERRLRRLGDVPRGQEVVHAYGNTDEGDMTAGLQYTGPAGAHRVGLLEARAMLRAWKRAAVALVRAPALAVRSTVSCFCGVDTAAGPVDDHAVVGLPFTTGSEENRGPLYDETGVPFEGTRLPAPSGPQGYKVPAFRDQGQFPTAAPLTAARVADRAIVTVPGEMSSGMGRYLRAALLGAARGSGIERIVISGLANDFLQYFVSPLEYDTQHYEGGSTLFGRASAIFVQEQLADLVARMVRGRPAPAPDRFDARNGVTDDEPRFPAGARDGEILAQPKATRRLDSAELEWSGGPDGLDRPLDRRFVTVERRVAGGWRAVGSDLGLRMLWTVTDRRYRVEWEAPLAAPPGRYRFLVSANRYRLQSEPFRLRRANDLEAHLVESGRGRAVIELRYPAAVENRDLTWRPFRAREGEITVRIDGSRETIESRGGRFVVEAPAGAAVTLAPGAAHDAAGNRNGNRLAFEL